MLRMPDSGFTRSVKKNRIAVELLGDWIEGSLYFAENRVSNSDIVDILEENHICDAQGIGHEIAAEGFVEVKERRRITGDFDGITFRPTGASLSTDWRQSPVEAFFLLLSLFRAYDNFPGDARDMGEQGIIFEELVQALLQNMFQGWEVLKVGWSKDDPVSITEVARDLANRLNCQGATDVEDWVSDHAKDGGLDVVCYLDLQDGKEAMPVLFVQCASGANWAEKIHTPSPYLWMKLLNSAVKPAVALAAPFIIDRKMLRRKAAEGQLIVIDRLRLLKAYQAKPEIVSDELKQRIVVWMEPIVEALALLGDAEAA